jgi:hypothetical protein
MCYSAEVSIGTFLLVESICVFLWARNRNIDRALSLILSVIVFMQLLEYLLWTNPECNLVNKTITSIIPTYLFLQPAAIAAILLYFKAGWGGLYPYIFVITLLVAFLYPFDARPPCISPGKCGHLDWNLDVDSPHHSAVIWLYNAAMLYLFATLKNTNFAIASTSFYLLSWAVARTSYGREWSSVWCHSVNAMALVAPLM